MAVEGHGIAWHHRSSTGDAVSPCKCIFTLSAVKDEMSGWGLEIAGKRANCQHCAVNIAPRLLGSVEHTTMRYRLRTRSQLHVADLLRCHVSLRDADILHLFRRHAISRRLDEAGMQASSPI
ncbi:hypothetical protein LY76DRAFT_290357 [Colletotrichum caudatum]|nr:hypothetical protein LY76DRAFT_290357 [Colletotrichum caudatum]